MSESALYRRYRPQSFPDVIGQDHIVKAIEGAIKNTSFAHAYLFSGSRGTGKTSIARIFAAEIGVTPNDLYEIDAASNRGIDDVRELRESVHGMPMESPYKVYIIDEVHMLTKEAFNALLKTLEEPPAHVMFMLATTELHKLPDTVVSRCQTFHFHKPNQTVLKEVVDRVAKEEGYKLEGSSADLIALLGEGSFRDTLGMLQKVLSAAGGKTVTEEEVEAVTGAPRSETINKLIEAIGSKDLSGAFFLVHQVSEQNADIRLVISLLLQKLRTTLLLRFAPDLADKIKEGLSEDEFVFLSEKAKDTAFVLTADTIRNLLEAHDETARAAVPELPLELALTRLLEKESAKG
ncbi:MAG: DNA polymerase III subunit gamma/tau [Candidatus Paceibacterota bacterium]